MKWKLLLLITVAVLVAAACAAPPTNRSDTNRNGSAESTTAAAPMTEADAMAKEKAVFAAFEKQDYKGFADMLDEQAVLVQGTGVYNKAEILKDIQGFVPKDVVFSDWKFISLDKDAAVISYKQSFAGTVNGQPMPASTLYGTTAWVHRNGSRWPVHIPPVRAMQGNFRMLARAHRAAQPKPVRHPCQAAAASQAAANGDLWASFN